jgi:hypothetical protein
VRSERDFDEWVRQRLASWPAELIHDFERWLLERGLVEFVPAVHGAAKRRRLESRGAPRPQPSAPTA